MLSLVVGKHVRRGPIRVHRMVQECVGNNARFGSSEQYGAIQLRELVADHQLELLGTLRPQKWSKRIHIHKFKRPSHWKQLQVLLTFSNSTSRSCAGAAVPPNGDYDTGHKRLPILPLKVVLRPRTARMPSESRIVSQIQTSGSQPLPHNAL